MAANRIGKTLLILASTVLGLALSETILRLDPPLARPFLAFVQFGASKFTRKPEFFRPDRDLFWINKNISGMLSSARDQRPKIVYLGDSCTQFGTWPGILSEKIRGAFGLPNLPFLPAATAGWSSYQGRVLLERDLLALHPAVMTLYFGWNDHWKAFGMTDSEVGWSVKHADIFGHESRLLELLLVGYLKSKKGKMINRVPIGEFHDNLVAMASLAQANRITPVLLTAPSAHVLGQEPQYLGGTFLWSLEQLVPLHARYADEVRQAAAETHSPLCDLAEDFSRLPHEEVAREYFKVDGIHLTEQGSQKAAEFLYACFERNRILELLK